MEPQPQKLDPMPAFFSSVFKSKRLMTYAQVCAMDLPADLRDRLTQYRNLLMGLAGVSMLILIHARLWTLCFVAVAWIGIWPVKRRMEKALDADVPSYLAGKR